MGRVQYPPPSMQLENFSTVLHWASWYLQLTNITASWLSYDFPQK